MPLVEYDSSSDDSDPESKPQPVAPTSTKVVPSQAIDTKDSIASFLPAPKNRQPQTTSKGRILGAGIKNTINSQIAYNPDSIVLSKSTASVTSLVPSSLRGKNKKITTQTTQAPVSEKPLPVNLNLFQDVKSRPKPVSHAAPKIEVRSITHDDDGDVIIEDDALPTDQPHHTSVNKRPHDEDEQTIKEFNVTDFYDQNIELKAQGLLQENKRLHTVTNHKNQLSALVKNAKLDQDLLEEKFERNKKQRKEKADRYGW